MNPVPADPRELTEAAFARLSARDIDGFLEFVHPEAEFVPLLAGVEGGRYVGHEGVRRWLTGLLDAWEGYTVLLKATHAISDRVVMVEFMLRLRGRGSEVELETQAFGVFERDESLRLVTGWRFYETAAAAREAALAAAAAR